MINNYYVLWILFQMVTEICWTMITNYDIDSTNIESMIRHREHQGLSDYVVVGCQPITDILDDQTATSQKLHLCLGSGENFPYLKVTKYFVKVKFQRRKKQIGMLFYFVGSKVILYVGTYVRVCRIYINDFCEVLHMLDLSNWCHILFEWKVLNLYENK